MWRGTLPFIEADVAKYPDDLSTWNEAWRIISKDMLGLKELRVKMVIYDDERERMRSDFAWLKDARKRWTGNGARFEALLGECARDVRGLKVFRLGVEMPWGEEVCWDVAELENRIAKAVCGPRRLTV